MPGEYSSTKKPKNLPEGDPQTAADSRAWSEYSRNYGSMPNTTTLFGVPT